MDKARKKYRNCSVFYCPELEDKKYELEPYVLAYDGVNSYDLDAIRYYISYQTGIDEKNISLY